MKFLLDLQALQSGSRRRGIGSYSRGLAQAMLAKNDRHEWHVLFNAEMPETLPECRRWAEERVDARRIHVFSGLAPTRGTSLANAERARAASFIRDGFVSSLLVDLVHVASPFEGYGDEAVAGGSGLDCLHRAAVAATVYDFIPFQEPKLYLADKGVNRFYQDRMDRLKTADHFLAISEHTCGLVEAFVGAGPERTTAIGTDVDPIYRPPTNREADRQWLLGSLGIDRPYVMHVGMLEARKNVAALVRAFAKLAPEIREAHLLVLVADATHAQREEMKGIAAKAGLRPEALVFPGHISNEDLASVYAEAAVTIMPSVTEGFGLPLLEAMRCGSPVLGSSTTSIPEVIGHSDLLFDPADTDSIAAALTRILTDADFRRMAVAHAERQAKVFSWPNAADKAIGAFEVAVERSRAAPKPRTSRPRRDDEASLASGMPASPGVILVEDTLSEGQKSQLAVAPALIRLDARGQSAAAAPRRATPTEHYRLVGLTTAFEPDADPEWSSDPALFGPSAVGTMVRDDGDPPKWRVRLAGANRSGAADDFSCDDEDDAVRTALLMSPLAHAPAVVDALRGLAGLGDEERLVAALAVADNHAPLRRPRRLLVDVTHLARHDARSGIQRVVRNILARLADMATEFRIEPIWRDGVHYRFARSFGMRFLQRPSIDLPDALVDFRSDDVFLGLDLDAAIPADAVTLLQRQHQRGMTVIHVVYDLLPIIGPQWFDPGMTTAFEGWIKALAALSDGLACISNATAEDVRTVLRAEAGASPRAIEVGYFHLGADLDTDVAKEAGEDADPALDLGAMTGASMLFLTVGTIEPRKGHAQLVDAAEAMWAAGEDVAFVVVGKRGWLVDALLQRIEGHPELGKRLVWLEQPSDGVLQSAYRQASAALLVSEGEGFGLPLIEAAHFGVPILARDLLVFREIGGDGVHYFKATNGEELAAELKRWKALFDQGRHPKPDAIGHLSWTESARQLLRFVRTVRHRG